MRIWLAIVSFFKVLFDAEFARGVRKLLEGVPTETPAAKPVTTAPVAATPQRSDAIALLATLQREARFVDLVNESLDGYSDAQIGAAARDVLRDSKKVLDRLFALEPVAKTEEGKSIEVPAGYECWTLSADRQCVAPAAAHRAADARRMAGDKMRFASLDG